MITHIIIIIIPAMIVFSHFSLRSIFASNLKRMPLLEVEEEPT
jgi:hypothetical protein